jgi:hypothetical protein
MGRLMKISEMFTRPTATDFDAEPAKKGASRGVRKRDLWSYAASWDVTTSAVANRAGWCMVCGTPFGADLVQKKQR